MTATKHLAVSTALRKRIAESCARDLSKAFAAWLLEDFNQPDLRSIAARAAKSQGADEGFQIAATLGFAADAGVLSEPELAALKNALGRLSGRSPMADGLPRRFCADAVGILGIAVGTAVIANAEVTGQVMDWERRFLKRIYQRDHTKDWHRCLFAAADRKLGASLKLALPNNATVADVRLALLAKGVITYPDTQVQQDAARVLQIAIQETSRGVECERAALCLAAVERVIRREGKQGERAGALIEHISTNPPPASREDGQSDIDPIPRKKRGRPAKIPDELKEKALAVQGTTARAKILYQTQIMATTAVAMSLRVDRSALGISQSRLARLSGVSRFKICTFELGSGALSNDELDRISTALRAEADRLRSISRQIGAGLALGEDSYCATPPPNTRKVNDV